MELDSKQQDQMAEDIVKLSKEFKKVIDHFLIDYESKSLLLVPTIALALAQNIVIVAEAADKAMGIDNNAEMLLKLMTNFVKTYPKMEKQVAKENRKAH